MFSLPLNGSHEVQTGRETQQFINLFFYSGPAIYANIKCPIRELNHFAGRQAGSDKSALCGFAFTFLPYLWKASDQLAAQR